MLGFETEVASAPPRSRGRLVGALVAGGVLLGLVVAGGVSVIGSYLDAQTAAGPTAPPAPRATPSLATLGCGAPAPGGAVDPERTLALELLLEDARVDPRFAPGTLLPVTVRLVNPGGDPVDLRAASDVVVVAVSGTGVSGTGVSGTGVSGTGVSGTGVSGTGVSGGAGADAVVVGAPVRVELRDADERRRDPYRLTVPAGMGVPAGLTYPLVACDGRPLLAGEYALQAALVVTGPDGGAARELVSLPVPVAVE